MSRRLYYGFVVILVAIIVLPLALFEETKPFVDRFGNHASVLGLFLSVVGFALTVWTVLETMRVSRESQEQVRREIERSRKETAELMAKLRLVSIKEICDQTSFLLSTVREAILDSHWLRAIEKAREAATLVHRSLHFREIEPGEVIALRKASEEIPATIDFIARTRLNKPSAPKGLPSEKMTLIDQLLQAMNEVRSRLAQSLYEVPHASD